MRRNICKVNNRYKATLGGAAVLIARAYLGIPRATSIFGGPHYRSRRIIPQAREDYTASVLRARRIFFSSFRLKFTVSIHCLLTCSALFLPSSACVVGASRLAHLVNLPIDRSVFSAKVIDLRYSAQTSQRQYATRQRFAR